MLTYFAPYFISDGSRCLASTGSGELVKSELARVTKAVAIDNLTAIASSLSVIKKDLWEIKNTTLQLQEQTSNLQSGQSYFDDQIYFIQSQKSRNLIYFPSAVFLLYWKVPQRLGRDRCIANLPCSALFSTLTLTFQI